MNTHPNGKGIGDERSGGDDLSVGDIEHATGFIDQHKSQSRKGLNRPNHNAADNQLKKIAHIDYSIV